MLGLSPAKLSQAADGAMSRSPSARLSVDNTAKTTAKSLQERISLSMEQRKNEKWSSELPFQGIGPHSDDCIQHDDILTFVGLKMLTKKMVGARSTICPVQKDFVAS